MDALDAGLHVLLEIPLANTLAEADAMIATADRTKLKLMVAEDVRFQNRFRKVAELIKSGAVGDVFLIRINREHEKHAYMRERPWWLAQKTGGIMVSGGIHDYEFLRMLAGEIEHVYGLEAPKAIPEMLADDTSVALIRLQSGAVAFFTESFSLKTPEPGVNGSVHGTGGSIWFSGNRVRAYTAAEDGHPELVEVVEVPPHNKFEAEDAHFLDCLDNDTEPLTSAREERKPLLAMLATYESFRRGGRVYVCEIESSDFNWDSWH
jgi:predicted dehydrogenase